MPEATLDSASFPLPSRGVWYDNKVPGGVIQIRRSTMREDLMLDSPTIPMNEKLNRLCQTCSTFPEQGFAVADLLLTDRLVLALAIRSLTYGAVYNFSFFCLNPRCRMENKTTVDFGKDLIERTPETIAAENPDMSLVEPFALTLPISGSSVGFRHLRCRDEEEIEKIVKTNKMLQAHELPASGIDPATLIQLLQRLVSIDGQPAQFSKALEFALALNGRDNRAIYRHLDKFETGVRAVVKRKCKTCSYEQEVGVPLTLQVFRSDSDSE